MSSKRTPLVEQDHPGCPSSYDSIPPVEQAANMIPTPLPKLQVFIILLVQFGEPLTATVVFPFVVQLIRDTGITGGDEAKTGYYAGFMVSDLFSTNIGQSLNSCLIRNPFSLLQRPRQHCGGVELQII
jgi:hypothetical protein